MKTRPTAKDVDAFLASLPAPKRAALEKLRATIRAAAPKAEETLSYGLPAFWHHGPLVSYGAAAKHCAFYVMSGTALAPFEAELAKLDTSKGTIRFAGGAAAGRAGEEAGEGAPRR